MCFIDQWTIFPQGGGTGFISLYWRELHPDMHNCNWMTFDSGGVSFTWSAGVGPVIEQFIPHSLWLSFPSGVPTDLCGLTREKAEEKSSSSWEPLLLNMGLLIQTIKAQQPCFTFTMWPFSYSEYDALCVLLWDHKESVVIITFTSGKGEEVEVVPGSSCWQ